jgi:integrase
MTSLALRKSDFTVIPPTAFILRSRPLREHIELATTSRFSDDIWTLTPAVHQVHKRQISLHFLDVPIQFRQTVKELIFALLVIDLPPGHKEIRVITIYARFLQINQFLVWVDQRGGMKLNSLTSQDLLDFQMHIKSERNSRGNDLVKLASVRLLWQFRSKLTSDTLPLDPHPLWFDATVHGRRQRSQARENRTPRIPEQVLAPLMTWALRWVEDFADDVLRARNDWAELQATVPDVDRTRGVTTRRLTALLSEYRADRRPLPRVGMTPKPIQGRAPVNLNHLAREAGVHQETISHQHMYWHLIQETLDEVGLDDATYLRTPIHASVDNEPWLRAVATDEIGAMLRRLQSACYIVIAYLSGMRDAEIKHLERGCLQRWCDEDGEPIRYKLTSQAFKGENTPLGIQATWVVTATVARAVDVLERLVPEPQRLLFASPPVPKRTRGKEEDQDTTPHPKQSHTTVNDINAFSAWVNDYCAERRRSDGIPTVDGCPWRFTTRQFRRTLAWSIARQPGGSIAGAIQYRHQSIQMFEGYAGTSSSGFRQEVEAEQAFIRSEQLCDLVLDAAPERLAGPAGEEAEARLKAIAGDVQFPGKVIADRKRLQRHITRHDPHVYPGEFVTCVYNPDRALCRRAEADGPSLQHCQPLACRNVALTTSNIDAFRRWLLQMEEHLGDPTMAPYLRSRLAQRRDEVAQFLADNDIPQGDNGGTANDHG